MGTPSGPTREVIADYSTFNFEALWRGREKVTAIEQALVCALLRGGPRERVLEIGTGFGRLTAAIRTLSTEYVGVDLDPAGLARARAAAGGNQDASSRWVVANLHHLPFTPGSFSAVVMVRLAHHLPRWEETTQTLAALLRPGGRCIVTVFPSPTIGTFAEDLKGTLNDGSPWRWGTFARGEDFLLSNLPHPKYLGSRRGYRRALEHSGLRIVVGLGSGLEEVVPGISAAGWVTLASLGEPLPLFPMKWYAADRPGPAESSLPRIDAILVCPRCRSSLPGFGMESDGQDACAQCGFQVQRKEGLTDLRYLPEGTVRIGAPVSSR